MVKYLIYYGEFGISMMLQNFPSYFFHGRDRAKGSVLWYLNTLVL